MPLTFVAYQDKKYRVTAQRHIEVLEKVLPLLSIENEVFLKKMIFNFLFFSHSSLKIKWVSTAGVIGLYISGLILWGMFINWNNPPEHYQDWAMINLPRLAFTQNALQQGVLPLHISNPTPLAGSATDRFLTIPDVMVSPQLILLTWMDVGDFILLNIWLLYTIGFLGLIKLKKRFQLSLFSFAILFFLFNFNGHIQAHISVGHLTWVAYFLYSWFVELVFEFLDGAGGWKWLSKMAFLLLLIWLQGGYHQVIYACFFLFFLGIAIPHRFFYIIKTLAATGLVSMIRILPPILSLGQFKDMIRAVSSGFPNMHYLWESFVSIMRPNDITLAESMTKPVGVWELTYYVGMLGILLLIIFGIIFPFQKKYQVVRYLPLYIPIFSLIVLSMSKGLSSIQYIFNFPPFSGERAASRLLCLSFVFVLAMALNTIQKWLDNLPHSYPVHALLVSVFFLQLHDLWQFFRRWRIISAASPDFQKTPYEAAWYIHANHPDPLYSTMLITGLVISVFTAIGLATLSIREQKN